MAGQDLSRAAPRSYVFLFMHIFYSSLAKGIELGIVGHLPIITTRQFPSTEIPKNDPIKSLLQNRKRYASQNDRTVARNPLNGIEYNVSTGVTFKE